MKKRLSLGFLHPWPAGADWIFSLVLAIATSLVPVSVNPARAGEADVVDARVIAEGQGRYRFDVTIRHGDTGNDDFADRWEVIGADGTVYASRVIAQPHVGVASFHSSLDGVEVPGSVDVVVVQAHATVDKWGGRAISLRMPDR